MYVRILVLAVALLLPSVAWGQALLTDSFAQRANTPDFREAQLARCDISTSILGNGPIGGEDACVSASWTLPLDCRDMTNISVRFFEYGTGSGEANIWDCISIPGPLASLPSTLGGTVPGVEDPASAPTPADPDPLCVSLNDAATVTLIGTTAGTQFMNLSDQSLHFIVGEIDDCTNNCDSTLVVSCGR